LLVIGRIGEFTQFRDLSIVKMLERPCATQGFR